MRRKAFRGRILALTAAALATLTLAQPTGAADDNLTAALVRLLVDPRVPYIPGENEPRNPFPRTTIAGRMQSANNLKQIALAMHNFHDANNGFPAAAILDAKGKPLLSWRVAILPYIEEDNLYRQFKLDEPWDSAHNKKLLPLMPRTYAPPIRGKPLVENATYYQVFTGPDTVFDLKQAQGNGALTLGMRLTNITDGTSNTAMVVEAAEPVLWTKPDDVEFDLKKPVPVLGGLFKAGYHVALCDGSVRFVSRTKIKPDTLRAIVTPSGGEVIGNDF